jgi:hypothetical protein
MGAQDEKDVASRLFAMFENLQGTPPDELRTMLTTLDPKAEAEEEAFIQQLRIMQAGLRTATADEAHLRGLISEARKCGLSVAELATAVQLSTALVKKLDLRLIRYASIPHQVIERVAGAIKRSAEQVAMYLQGDPIRTADAYSVHSPAAPDEPQDFFELVSTDASLSEEYRARLMGMVSQ